MRCISIPETDQERSAGCPAVPLGYTPAPRARNRLYWFRDSSGEFVYFTTASLFTPRRQLETFGHTWLIYAFPKFDLCGEVRGWLYREAAQYLIRIAVDAGLYGAEDVG